MPAPSGSTAQPGRFLSRDEFADRYQSAWRVLWCVAAGIIGRADSPADVVQQAAIIALQRLECFDPDSNFTAWMAQIVRNTALNHARKLNRRRTGTADPESVALQPSGQGAGRDAQAKTTTIDPRGQLLPDQSAFDDRVRAALNLLEPDARACLLLRTVLDMPYAEIARALDVPEGTVASHVHRARSAMRAELVDTHAPLGPPAPPARPTPPTPPPLRHPPSHNSRPRATGGPS